MAFVIWLLSPYTRGASLLYRKFVHPTLSRKEKVRAAWLIEGGGGAASPTLWGAGQGLSRTLGSRCAGTWCCACSAPLWLSRQEIDTYIVQARERGYETMVRFGKRGLNMAATAAVQAAAKVPGTGLPSLLP